MTAQVLNHWGVFRAVYDLRESTKTWHGTLVWPSGDGDYSLFSGNNEEPRILPLHIAETKDQTFILVVGKFLGADASAKHVWIWQWKDNHLEVALKIRLSNWCGHEWHNWEVTEEGILVNATVSTERCEAREAILYYWKNGEFKNRTP